MARPIHPVVVGTAGHIDHGKSSLVRRLTGIDPDRLKEEKERGLTIDLGFARLKMRDGRWLGMIDVPGHERFIRNMVAGSTGLDLALLVVAADDGVMPQTREHLDILDLLGVRRGLVALTKCDLVDEDTLILAEAEVRELLEPTVLADAPVLRVSSETGEGVEELREALEELARGVEPRPSGGPFRMPVQRVFTLEGIGTVVTGVPLSGRLTAGEEVEFLPHRGTARVRGLHAYGGKVERAQAGHSTALSVPEARDLGLRRGVVAATPGVFGSGDAVDIDLRLLPRAPDLEHRVPVRFHTGTNEIRGQLLLLDRDVLRGGESAVARVTLLEELCCAPGDRFLVRLQNPVMTVGGGHVLRLQEAPRRYRRAALGEELTGVVEAGARPEARIRHELTQSGPHGRRIPELAGLMAVEEDVVREAVGAMDDVYRHERADRLFLRSTFEEGIAEVLASVDRILAARKLAATIVRTSIRTSRNLPSELLEAVLEHLIATGRVRPGSQGRLTFLDRLQPLPPEDRAHLDRVVGFCEQAGWRPPTAAGLEAGTGLSGDRLAGLVSRAEDEGLLARVGDHLYGGRVLWRTFEAIVANCRRHGGLLDIPELRDTLGTSRKFLIPLLEYVDSMGLTILRGGVRRLLPDAPLTRRVEAGGGE